MSAVIVKTEKMVIPTYENAPYEELPMFSFNRFHQGTSGNPYPHRVVNKLRRDSLRYREAKEIAEAIGYKIVWVKDE